MTTLAIMKARIATELRRDNITAQIASAITTAISELEAERFYFNESREFTFPTVALQEFYDVDDSALIPRVLKRDYVNLYLGNSVYCLGEETPERMEWLSQNGISTGQPLCYCWYNDKFRVYPVPTEVYTIRIAGLIQVAAPASDAEASNPWMTKAEKLVRCYAKYELYENVIFDTEKAQIFNPKNDAGPTGEAMRVLKARTNNQKQQGGWIVRPVAF